MGYRIVEPHNLRAKIEHARMQKMFPNAVETVRGYGPIVLSEMGADWNRCIFERTKRGGIIFTLGGENGSRHMILDGMVRNVGYDNIRIDVQKGISGVDFSDNYIVNSVSEGVQVCSKLEIITNELLPSGDEPPASGEGSGDRTYPDKDNEQYRIFAAEVLDKAKKIIVSTHCRAFGKYVVVESHQGFFIAYNKDYGEGTYIVDDFELLLFDKQTIKKEGLAITFRRDRRGNWEDRIREYL